MVVLDYRLLSTKGSRRYAIGSFGGGKAPLKNYLPPPLDKGKGIKGMGLNNVIF